MSCDAVQGRLSKICSAKIHTLSLRFNRSWTWWLASTLMWFIL